ncbi:hypothetical protein ACJ77P_06585 [Syntrophus buswellii]|uniref:hypothetical protein n=1 Tax=Syntrophus buswellii TaxID=43774 RepID=UPI0038D424A5
MTANEQFCANPIQFLIDNTLINYQPESHIYGKLVEPNFQKKAKGINMNQHQDGDGKIRYDLANIGNRKYVLRRLVPAAVSNAQGVAVPAWPADYIEGNYFPYLPGGVANLLDMGQITVNTLELPVFTFTGAMNGCAFVVTDTVPRQNNHYVCYHYQSPESNPLYGPNGAGRFPGTMRCYVQASDYLPAAWQRRFTHNALPATFIFMWRNPRTGELRIISETVAVRPDNSVPNYHSKLVQSWRVQSNAEVGAAIRPYTNVNHQVHVRP